MLNKNINFGIVNSDSFSINLNELSARINKLNIKDEYDDLIKQFNSYAQYRFAYAKVSLSEQLFMTPSKSITAIIGIY